MPICLNCNKEFPNSLEINKKNRNLQNRKFCLICSPFGLHNTKNITKSESQLKQCPMCKISFPPTKEHFYSRRGKPSSPYCKKCSNVLTTQRGIERKAKAVAYKGGKCIICNYDRHQNCFDFHHTDPSNKDRDLSFTKLRLQTWEKFKHELDKCILVCRNCHGEIHAGLHPQYLVFKDPK